MKNSVVFGLTTLSGLVWLLGAWPGYTQFDSFSYIKNIRAGKLQVWHSIGFSHLTSIVDLFPNPVGLMSVLLIFCFAGLMTYWWKLLKNISDKNWNWLFFLIILNPLILSMNIFYNREVPFAFLGCLLSLFLYRWKYISIPSKYEVIIWSLLLGVFSELRQDARLYLILFPLVAYLLLVFDRKKLAYSVAIAFVVNIIISAPLYMEERYQNTRTIYSLTGTYSTLMSLDHEKLSNEDLEVIRKIVNFNKTNLELSNDRYTTLLQNTFIGNPETRSDYYWKIVTLFFKDLPGVMWKRIQFFGNNLAIKPGFTEWYADALGPDKPPVPIADEVGIVEDPIFDFLYEFQQWFEKNVFSFYPVKLILFSNLWAFLFFAGSIFMLKKTPVTSVIGVLMMVKYGIICLLSPLPFANYLYLNYLAFLLVLPFFIFEIKKSRSSL